MITQAVRVPTQATGPNAEPVLMVCDSYAQWSAGRLTAIHYAGANCKYTPPLQGQTPIMGNNYIEMSSYTQAGDITNKKLRLWKQVGTIANPNNPTTALADLEAVYTYTSEGKINTLKYPLGTTYQFGYETTTDLMGTVS